MIFCADRWLISPFSPSKGHFRWFIFPYRVIAPSRPPPSSFLPTPLPGDPPVIPPFFEEKFFLVVRERKPSPGALKLLFFHFPQLPA